MSNLNGTRLDHGTWLPTKASYNKHTHFLERRVNVSVTFRRISLLIVGLILALINICPVKASNSSNWQAKGIADGAGVWINMWNYPADADSYCLKLYSNGIRNIFIQSSRSNTEAICNPQGLSRLLNAAHRYQMRVIAWSFDELGNPTTDAKKVIAVANFSNAEGQRVDAVAANLEKDSQSEQN